MEKNSFASRVVHMEKHEHGGSKEAADQEAKWSILIDRRAKPFQAPILWHFSFSRHFLLACFHVFFARFFTCFHGNSALVLAAILAAMLSRLATSFRRC